MGRSRNIYVSDRDAELYEWAKRYAYEQRMTVSAVVMMAVEQLRERVEGDAEK